ncbi:MAG: tripartite tricarboxylate transporter substrate binding protein [Clostridium sp.]|nr:tripartite tricarboxylate transporter substrate binding protein [Clostridium sp.]
MKRILALFLAAAVASSVCVSEADAGEFPARSITIIVPWSPGGTNDLMARAMQPTFKEKFGVDLVVKNSPGGASAVGITEVLTARNDGYTVGLASSSFLILVAQGRMQADPKAVENLVLVAAEPVVLVTKANGKYANAQDFLAAAKANPGKVSIGIPGANTVNQAYSVLLGRAADTEFNFIAFDGGSRVIADVIGGHIDAGALKPSEIVTQVKAGELVVIGVCNKEGLAAMPEVPTFESLGYDVFTLGNITQASYVIAPQGVKTDVKTKLASMFKEAIASDTFTKFATERGIIATANNGYELDTYIDEVYAGIVKASESIFTK